MSIVRRDFDKEAALWDESPTRLKLASDIANSIFAEMDLDGTQNVLDFGCGTGLLTFYLQPNVRSVTGIDSSHKMIEIFENKATALGLNCVSGKCLNVEDGDLITGSYQLVMSSMAFHHVKDIRLLLEQLYDVTASGGMLCIADLDSDNGQFHDDNTGIFHFGFERQKLVDLLTEIGFCGIKHKTAATVTKTGADGETRSFTIFLVSAKK